MATKPTLYVERDGVLIKAAEKDQVMLTQAEAQRIWNALSQVRCDATLRHDDATAARMLEMMISLEEGGLE